MELLKWKTLVHSKPGLVVEGLQNLYGFGLRGFRSEPPTPELKPLGRAYNINPSELA